MAITGVGNYAQNSLVRSPVQDNVSFDDQNTKRQRAEVRTDVQPKGAESAQSLRSENSPRNAERVNSFNASDDTDQDGSISASSSNGRSEELSFEREQDIDRNAPRGSYVDFLA